MTELLDIALESARQLPLAIQDDVARLILNLAVGESDIVALGPEEDDALALSEMAAERGEFATDAEVREVWAKHGL